MMLKVRTTDCSFFEFQSLEQRLLMAATPSSVLTKATRQTLLNNLTVSVKSTLQADLNANNLGKFDQDLLNYFDNRTSGQFYFAAADVPDYISYLHSNFTTSDITGRANDVLSNLYPLQDSANDTLTLPSDIDWTKTDYSTNPETIHTLNRQAFWVDLAQAYRLTDNTAYASKLISQLADWSSQAPALSNPNDWQNNPAPWWRLNAAMRAENWAWTYSLMVGTPAWTKEANTLFLAKALEHGQFLYTASPAALTSNQAFLQGKGLLCIAMLFPEFSASGTWKTAAENLVFNTMDAQFYNDGSHAEQSPGYASVVLRGLLEAELLENKNGVTWTAARQAKLTKSIDAIYELLTPDSKEPAMSDTYRATENQLWFHADLVMNTTRWPVTRPSSRDAWVFGPDAVNPYLGNSGTPALGSRPNTYALPDSGNYIMRSGSDTDARQILFDAGPKGGTHGHFDLFNFELFGYGKPLISDPGLYMYDTSSKRNWAISTPAHNTVSIDGLNTGAIEGSGNPAISIDQWDVQQDHVQVTAHHFGYGYLSGRPIVSRSIWYDYDNTMIVVDWVDASESHTVQTSFLIPGTSTSADLPGGEIRSTNGSGGNVQIQALPQSGQTATTRTGPLAFTSSSPPPNQQNAATQFVVAKVGSFVGFATLITAYNGTTPPDNSAQLLSSLSKTSSSTIRLTKNGSSQDITFTPPTLNRPDAKGSTNGQYTDIAYDAQGRLHMAYLDRVDLKLKYTVRDTNGTWSPVEVVDSARGSGYSPSIAIDSAGNVGIAYNDSPNGDLKYAQYRSGAWTIQRVDTRGTTGLYPSLAFTRKDSPVITYYDHSKLDLRMASATSTGWSCVTIDSGSLGNKDVGRASQLMLDPSRPTASKWTILYQDTGGQRFRYAVQGALKNGEQKGGYTFFTVASAPKLGGYTSLAFDASNRPTISFYDSSISGLRFAQSSGDTYAGISFTSSIITQKGTTGLYSNLYFDTTGKPTVLYYDKTKNAAFKAVFSNKKWTAKSVVAGGGRELHVALYNRSVAFTTLNQSLGKIQVNIG